MATIASNRMPTTGRLYGDRFRRVWAIVEHIAERPGQTRRELADTFHLSERQVQADILVIREGMRLPLVRRSGYRFISEGVPSGRGACDLREAQLLVMVLLRASSDRSLPRERLDGLLDKLPSMFPPHLTPVVGKMLDAVGRNNGSRRQEVIAALGDALLRGVWVKLHTPDGTYPFPASLGESPMIRPELLIPYLGAWYIVGQSPARTLPVMLRLTEVTAVTLAEAPAP